jgi:hypothetical protein
MNAPETFREQVDTFFQVDHDSGSIPLRLAEVADERVGVLLSTRRAGIADAVHRSGDRLERGANRLPGLFQRTRPGAAGTVKDRFRLAVRFDDILPAVLSPVTAELVRRDRSLRRCYS